MNVDSLEVSTQVFDSRIGASYPDTIGELRK